jgi:hypothetical protein
MRLALVSTLIGIVAFGCAAGEDIDPSTQTGSGGSSAGGGGKVDDPNAGGGAAGSAATGNGGSGNGGSGGAETGGGGGSAGAASGGGGASSGGSSGSGGSCASGQKQCGGVCIAPSPGIGCSLSNCDPCPNPPLNANSSCTGEDCDFTCSSGYDKSGSLCVPSGGTGGSSGTGGSGGGTGGATGCPAPCNPNDPLVQFLCFTFCAANGGGGLCLPAINCCVCAT